MDRVPKDVIASTTSGPLAIPPPLPDLLERVQRQLDVHLCRIRAWEEEGVRLAVLHGHSSLTLPVFGAPNPEWHSTTWDLSDPVLVAKALQMIREDTAR